MKEYTLLAAFSVSAAILLDHFLKTGILRKKIFYIFLLIIFLFKLAVNGYLTSTNIIIYNNRFFTGFRIGSIPVEDFLFGFSMVAMAIIFWEYFKKEKT